ncbi:hypothetical protein BGZ94_001068, partial [Podila epigama]
MGVKLFNDLITVLDVLPNSTTVNLCVNHPGMAAIEGKVRIIAKRPCTYKSLVLTATGSARISGRNGNRMSARQVFLDVSTEVIHQSPPQSAQLSTPLSSPLSSPRPERPHDRSDNNNERNDDNNHGADNFGTPIVPSDDYTSNSGSRHRPSAGQIAPLSPLSRQSSMDENENSNTNNSIPVDNVVQSSPQLTFLTNQLQAGVNDIDFRLEFPSHYDSHMACPASEVPLHCLPAGPLHTPANSVITYILRTTLTLSRRDILVNNQLSVTRPFRIQTWQDQIDVSHSEEHAFHGKRRDKIEFEFQVPKLLDANRLHELHLGFQGGWKVLDNELKVDKIHYYLMEEEVQT